MNRRARLVRTWKHPHNSWHEPCPWVEYGPIGFIEAAMEYARTFYGSFVASGDITPGEMFRVEVAETDVAGAAIVPPCVFEMKGRMEFDILNPRLGAE